MISRMTTIASEHAVDPGEEAEFLTQTPDQVRAVHVRLDAEDSKGRYLRLAHGACRPGQVGVCGCGAICHFC